jgi:hypothetical protein
MLVRPYGFAVLFERRQRDEAVALKISPRHMKVLDIRVDSVSYVLLQDTPLKPGFKRVSGPCVAVFFAIIGGFLFSFDYPHDVVLVFFVELLLLRGADNIIRRRDAASDITNHDFVKPKCFEGLDLHYHLLKTPY